MPHVITSLCLRDGSCMTVCPVDCIVPGKPVDQWPTYYIDADTCIDCDACVAECPYGAIFTDDEVPSAYTASGTELLSMPVGTPGYTEVYEGTNHDGEMVRLEATRQMVAGEVFDLTGAIQTNKEFFQSGPGYDSLNQ